MARGDTPAGKPPKRGANDPLPPAPQSWDERLVDALAARRGEVGGVLLFLLSIITLLALTGLTQAGWLGWWTRLLRQLFGWGTFVVCLFLAAVGLRVALGRVRRLFGLGAGRITGLVILVVTLMALSHLIGGYTLADAFAGRG